MKRAAVLFAALLIGLLAGSSASGQDAVPLFRTTTELVLLDVQVVHRKTRTSAPPLQQQHFQIYEDDVLQEIRTFSRDELPLSVVLLFDLTDTSRPVLRRLANSTKTMLTHLKPQDEVAVMVYAAFTKLVGDFTTDREQTRKDIDKAAGMREIMVPAFFNEAVYQAAMQLRKNNNSGRRVILWLTDNLSTLPDSANQARYRRLSPGWIAHTEEEAVRALHESGVTVAPLLLEDPAAVAGTMLRRAVDSMFYRYAPPGDARKYAEWTGGQALPYDGNDVDGRMAQIVDELRSRYTIGYQPIQQRPAGVFCKVRVVLAPEGPLRLQEWNVLAPAGYYRK